MLRSGFALLALALVGTTAPAADFFFQPKDRIVFLGDSITEQYQYSTYIELYLTTRFPQGEMLFLNAGIGGDTANGGANRFDAHVLSDKPTKVTINFGMNDAGYGAFNPETNKVYVAKTEAMLAAAKKAGVKVALLSPNAVDRRVQQNFIRYVETQKQFYAPLKAVAAKFEFPFVDQYAITRAAVESMEKDDPKAEKAKPYYDGFHTSPPGGLLMAHAILTGMNAPKEVSTADIGLEGTSIESSNCKIMDIEATKTGMTFTRLDKALPMPVQKDWVSMLPYTGQLNDLNYYGLKVRSLPAGDYDVKIDGVVVASHTAADLAKGVNLGLTMTGPVYDQGQKVMQKIQEKNNVVRDRFRNVTMVNLPDWLGAEGQERKQAERAKRLAKIESLQAEVYKLAQPVPHKFEVTKK
jgi:lysophospholipase L1-like esterase